MTIQKGLLVLILCATQIADTLSRFVAYPLFFFQK